jgi:hypothetical protein
MACSTTRDPNFAGLLIIYADNYIFHGLGIGHAVTKNAAGIPARFVGIVFKTSIGPGIKRGGNAVANVGAL